jgi:ABC-type sugar transport system substrate-binding protein
VKRLLTVLLLAAAAGSVGCGGGKHEFTVGFMPKLTGIPYFNACKRGGEEAAGELGIKLVYNGPTKADSGEQRKLLYQWLESGSYDCLAVACNEPEPIAGPLGEARQRGMKVVTFDADTRPDARDFFVNMATYDAVAEAMVDAMAEQLEPKGEGKVGILTSSVNAPNQSEWAKRIKAYAAKKYPKMVLLPEEQHGEDRDLGITRARAMITAPDNRDLKGIIGLTSVAVPAAAESVRIEKKKGQIKVTGVSTPKDMRDYVKDGTVEKFILWNPVDLGYLTVHVCVLVHRGEMPRDGTIQAGRLGPISAKDGEVLLGKPIVFTKENIDRYDF